MLHVSLIAIAFLGSLACFLFGVIAWRKHSTEGTGFIAGVLFSAAVYALGYGLELSSNSLDGILASLHLEYLGIVCLPGFWLAMVLHYTNRLKWLRPPRFFLLWIIPAIVLVAFYTNPFHHLYYANIALYTNGPFPVIQFDRGPIYILQVSYNIFALVASAILLFQYHSLPHALYRKQTSLILSCNLIILLVAILYFAGIDPIHDLDMVVYALIFTSPIIDYGLIHYHLVDLVPVAREMLFDQLSDSVIVVDGNDRLIDYNPQASQLLNLNENSIGSPLEAVVSANFLPAFGDLRSGPNHREFTTEHSSLQYYEMHRTTLPGSRNDSAGLLLVIHEITQMKQMQTAMEREAVQAERRRLARDLHDSVTQSLHSQLLNVGILRNRLAQGQTEKVEQSLNSLDQGARQALKEMRLLLFELRLAPLEDVRLADNLENRLEAVEVRAGIDAKVEVEETAYWPHEWEPEMYSIAMEALNNSLKHADATRVRVELRGQGSWAEMRISDNGKGFSPLSLNKAGFGLQSMRERAERLNGYLSIDSVKGRGTTICLQIGHPESSSKGTE